MSVNQTNGYDLDSHIPELYDRLETQTDDIRLIRRLIIGRGPLRIFEPFCGTGRILIPLAAAGHELVGLDQSAAMLARARSKIAQLPGDAHERITLIHADATAGPWPGGFDLVLLGGNCFYELATAEEQAGCIASAAAALRPGGHVYVDNDQFEGELDESWRCTDEMDSQFPTGACDDGTWLEGTVQTISFDAGRRLWRARRGLTVAAPDSRCVRAEWIQQKHPVSKDEVADWLGQFGFVIEQLFGDRGGSPWTPRSERAVFWARRARPA